VTANCPVCGKDIEEGSHGGCWRQRESHLLQVIVDQRAEIAVLRDRLIDAGCMRRGEK
jgi:hypothetical protein